MPKWRWPTAIRRVVLVLAAVTASLTGLLLVGGVASAATVVRVVNASGGVFWRTSADWASAVQNPGFGAYDGDKVSLTCYLRGGTVPPYNNNPLWYKASIASGRGSGSGFINDHFLQTATDDPDKPEADVPPCDPPQPSGVSPVIQRGASIYYSPFKGDWITNNHLPEYVKSVTNETLFVDKWLDGCNTGHVADFPDVIDGKLVTTLTGWSAGRLGPLLYLKAHPEKWAQIDYVLLYDPGNLAQLTADCPGTDFSVVLRGWLDKNPSAKLAILAGFVTADADHANGQYGHQGIQHAYFPKLRDPGVSERVTVCNYDGMGHADVWKKFQSWANSAPIQESCPADGDRLASARWHP